MDELTSPAGDPDERSHATDPEPHSATADAPADPPRRPRSTRVLRPWEALDRLDGQWVDPTPIERLAKGISTLRLTTADDPRGWDYLGAMTGAPAREVAAACAAWLEAQLAADVTILGRAYRPTVELVPAGRLWYVVRTLESVIVVIDGPGFLTPLAAASAAARRYGAELRRDLQSGLDGVTSDEEPSMSEASDAVAGEAADDPQAPVSPDDEVR